MTQSDERELISERSRRPARAKSFRGVAGVLLAIVVVALLANSLFLYTSIGSHALLAWMLKAHVWLGFSLVAGVLLFVVPHYLVRRRHRNRPAKVVGYLLAATVFSACGFGIFLSVVGRLPEYAWILRVHEVLFMFALLMYLGHRLQAIATPVLRYEFVAVGAVLAMFLALWAVNPDPAGLSEAKNGKPVTNVASDAGMLSASRARTIDGHLLSKDDLGNPGYCAECHKEISEQWDASAHHFSSFNDPFYAKTFEFIQKHRPAESTRFCGGCHDPLVLLTGGMTGNVTTESENSQAGITCLACHSIVEVPDRIGNGGYVVAKPDHYLYYDSKDPAEHEMNLQLIRAKPEQHKMSFLKPMHKTSEFCLACHKANIDIAVNQYRWKRGQNEYDSWHDSSAGMRSALTFYNGVEPKSCQTCHMPDVATNDPAARDGLTRDHTFAGANTALPMLKEKPEWARKTAEILQACCSVDIFSAVVNPSETAAERILPLERSDAQFAAGSTVRVEVMVRNRKVGHMFPGGTIDLNEPWLEFTVTDDQGQTFLASGLLDSNGRLDPSAHQYHNVMLTRDGRRVEVHNVEELYTLLYNNALPLGPSDIVRYDLPVPKEFAGRKIRLTARLQYRKFSRQYTVFALGPDAVQLPVFTINEDTVEVAVGETAEGLNPPEDEVPIAERINDFGIGHFRQGDLKTAMWAFERVSKLTPDNADTWINLARCHSEEGSLVRLETVLRTADQVRPGYHKTAFFLGRLLHAKGKFGEAADAYRRVLVSFPDDRVVLNAFGSSLYKAEKYDEAIKVFQHTLEVDPENVAAHSQLFLCYKAMGQSELARSHEVAYLRFQPLEGEKSVHEAYRQNDPNADREANLQHVHPLNPVQTPAAISLPKPVIPASTKPNASF